MPTKKQLRDARDAAREAFHEERGKFTVELANGLVDVLSSEAAGKNLYIAGTPGPGSLRRVMGVDFGADTPQAEIDAWAAALPQAEREGCVLVPPGPSNWKPTPGEYYLQEIHRLERWVGLHEEMCYGASSLRVSYEELASGWRFCDWDEPIDPERLQCGDSRAMERVP